MYETKRGESTTVFPTSHYILLHPYKKRQLPPTISQYIYVTSAANDITRFFFVSDLSYIITKPTITIVSATLDKHVSCLHIDKCTCIKKEKERVRNGK
jgi:hypothetical protein